MKPGKSKNKGGNFERDISKKLSLFLSNGERDDGLWRSQSSGARATNRQKTNKYTENQYGDISSTAPFTKSFIDKYIIELKHYKSINLMSLFNSEKNLISEWWSKLNNSAKITEKIPLLIIKANNYPILLISNDTFCNQITMFFDINYSASFYQKDQYLYFYQFDDILKLDYKTFLAMCEC